MKKESWKRICAGSVGWTIITVKNLLFHTPEPTFLIAINVFVVFVMVGSFFMAISE